MKITYVAAFCFVLLGVQSQAMTQSKRLAPRAISDVSDSKYFQLTLDLKFGPASGQPPTSQTITTEVAVRDGRPGSCKARMISQMPIGSGSRTKYIELGTKLDCNDVHIEENGIALQFTLETSRIAKMVKTKTHEGTEIDEPVITQRTVQLTVKLPLDKPIVVFDSRSHPLAPSKVKKLSSDATSALDEISSPPKQDQSMQIVITASELK